MIDLAQFIDHTLLKPNSTKKQIQALCSEAIQHNFFAVCIPPYFIEFARKQVAKTDVSVCSVVGFPFGYDHVGTKMDAIKRAIDMGADELDVVVNITAIKNGEWGMVESEIDNLATAIKLKGGKIFKLILETAYLERKELEILCNLCLKYNVDFAKTSTGFAPSGALVEDVEFMQSILGDKVKIKASGGIKSKSVAKSLIRAGASRLGTSAGMSLIKTK